MNLLKTSLILIFSLLCVSSSKAEVEFEAVLHHADSAATNEVDRSLVGSCADITSAFVVPGVGKKSCLFFKTRLQYCKSQQIVATNCPETCGLCCADNPNQFLVGSKNRKCSQGVTFPTLCKIVTFRQNCPETCGDCLSPTMSPTFSPTAPTFPPTFSPTMSPTFRCKDKPGLVSLPKFSVKRTCAQIKLAPSKWCKDIKAREFCRVSCNYCLCEDTKGSFKVGSTWRQCLPTQKSFCKVTLYRTKCPVLCDSCPWPPTAAPTSSPTAAPTSSPTAAPTSSPTAAPTPEPTSPPTESPTESPTETPTQEPTENSPFSMSMSMSLSMSLSLSMSMSLSMPMSMSMSMSM